MLTPNFSVYDPHGKERGSDPGSGKGGLDSGSRQRLAPHLIKPGHPPLSVPHPKKDLGVGLVHKLRKQAGL